MALILIAGVGNESEIEIDIDMGKVVGRPLLGQ